MNKVLVTGATGFIGRHSLPALSSRGYEVHAVTSYATGDKANLEGVLWHRANLLEREEVRALVSQVRPSHLLHFAWYAVPGKYWSSLENLCWVQASLDLIQIFAESGGKRVVAAGTCAEYDWGREEPCREEKTPLKPKTLYGACKHALWVMVEAYAKREELSAAWGRVFFIYGPCEHPSRLVASTVHSLLSGNEARCTNGQQVRDLMHVADVADAFVALLDSDVQGAVNIASGYAVTLRDVVSKIGAKLGQQDLIKLGAIQTSPGEPPVIAADTRRLNDEVGWRPRRDLNAGLDETIEWWRKNLA